MFILILLLILGSGFVYISKYNFMPVTVNLGMYQFSNIPLFYVIIGSVVLGIGISYLLHLASAITTALTLRGKNHEITKSKSKILELTKRVHQLELEKQKQASDDEDIDDKAL